MNLRYHVPAPPLDRFVALLWLAEGPVPAHARERVLPTGTTELVISLREGTQRVFDGHDNARYESHGGAVVSGAQTEYFLIDTAQQAAVIGVHFHPGGAFPFFGPPAGELSGQHVALDALWGARAAELRERLIEAPTVREKFRILEETLLARARRPLERHPAVAFALDRFERVPHAHSIASVAKRAGLSQRRFIARFRDEVGLAPKRYCRVVRFQEAIRQANNGRRVEWAHVAQACGYYDQAHLIADFRAFCGLRPTEYAEQRGEHLNHVPLAD